MEKDVFVYELIFSDGDRYIGITNNLEGRLKEHKKKFDDSNIQLKEIMKIEESKSIYWEQYYIHHYKKIGYNLKNKSAGGEGRIRINEDSKLSEKIQILISKEDLKSLYQIMFRKAFERGERVPSISSYVRDLLREELENKENEQSGLAISHAKKVIEDFKNGKDYSNEQMKEVFELLQKEKSNGGQE